MSIKDLDSSHFLIEAHQFHHIHKRANKQIRTARDVIPEFACIAGYAAFNIVLEGLAALEVGEDVVWLTDVVFVVGLAEAEVVEGTLLQKVVKRWILIWSTDYIRTHAELVVVLLFGGPANTLSTICITPFHSKRSGVEM